ncbi:hypothetical protein Bca52824_089796 [Brassica carinata]|uniref:Uncharacterized protein n=1 Tax=Brassica carinata TaxID=52824 RepID=A0A8X7TF93_BRACI|nr:hypothetical protein Bca52824_089796 [Brassica carinata]
MGDLTPGIGLRTTLFFVVALVVLRFVPVFVTEGATSTGIVRALASAARVLYLLPRVERPPSL